MEDKIIKIMENILEEKINTTSDQKHCENWDSLHHLNLILELELKFNVEFEPEEISKMTNVKKIIDILESKQDV